MGIPDTQTERTATRWPAVIPLVIFATGVLVFLVGSVRAGFTLARGGPIVVVLFDLVFVGIPGSILVYAGHWLPRSDVPAEYFPRILAWLIGSNLVMFGFILLRDLHPGVSAEWSIGTQAIALMIGSLGGLLIGIQETRATRRTAQLRVRTDELEARERQLERQNERLEEFSSVVSHDLRNPLSVASGRLQLAQLEDDDSEHLDHVAKAHSRMEVLIDDLLTLARDERSGVDAEPLALDTVVEKSWETVDTSDATLCVDVERTIRADESRLRQMLENLIRNAIEHGGEDVAVTVGELDDGFYVADDGPGIPAAERSSVLETGYSTRRDGTGFGLNIVKQVADSHEWTITIRNSTDGGARFEFTGVEWVSKG